MVENKRFSGIAAKVAAGLIVITMVTVLSTGLLMLTFIRFQDTFRDVSARQMPALVAASQLVQQAERLVASASNIIVAENIFIRRALADEIEENSQRKDFFLPALAAAEVPSESLKAVSWQFDQLPSKMNALIDAANDGIDMDSRIAQILMRLKRLSGKLNDVGFASRISEADWKVAESLDRWRMLLNQAVITIMAVPSVNDDAGLLRFQNDFDLLLDAADLDLRKLPPSMQRDLRVMRDEIMKHGTSERGILTLRRQQLSLRHQMEESLYQSQFLSQELVGSVNAVFSRIQRDITNQGLGIDRRIDMMSDMLIAIPVLCLFTAATIFTYIRRSVIGRILTLKGSMQENVEGHFTPISLAGHDEIYDMAESVNFFVTEINRRKQRLKESEEKYRNLFNTAPVGIVRTTMDGGRDLAANPAASEIFGFKTPEALVNELTLRDCFVDRSEYQALMSKLREGDKIENFVFLARTRQGQTRYLSLSGVVYADRNYMEVAFVDITERRQAEEALREAHLELERRVAVRTAELAERNEKLKQEIADRLQAEMALKESEERLRHLSSRLLAAQEDERRKLAAELHDDVGQSLGAVKFGLEKSIREIRQGQGDAAAQSMQTVVKVVKDIIRQLARLQMELRPSTLDDLGIVETIDWFCNEYQAIYSHIRIDLEVALLEKDVPNNLKMVFFRIIQEALSNVAKHSRAEWVRVRLFRTDQVIGLTVADNGLGFQVSDVLSRKDPNRGLGMESMRERAELSYGHLSVDSAPGRGTTIKAEWTWLIRD